MPNPDFNQPKFSRKECAAYIGSTPKTLADWACNKKGGPPYYKISKRVIYLRADVDAWLMARRVEPQPQT